MRAFLLLAALVLPLGAVRAAEALPSQSPPPVSQVPLPGKPLADLRKSLDAIQRGDGPAFLAETLKDADAGIVSAQIVAADMYVHGKLGVPVNFAEAAKWLKRAADQGNSLAQFQLSSLYASGNGVARDRAEAARLLKAAAEQDFAQAEFVLGDSYRKGTIVARNDVKATEWFLKAAEAGFMPSQVMAARAYMKGQGVPVDLEQAVFWMSVVADGRGEIADTMRIGAVTVASKLTADGIKRVQTRLEEWRAAKNPKGESF